MKGNSSSITFITGNVGKLAQVQRYLSYPITHQKLDLTEIQSLDPIAIVKHKAEEAYKHIGTPILIEDTSLTFLAMGKLPGTFIKWFLEELGKEGLCALLDGYNNRAATAKVLFCLYDGKEFQLFEGKINGSIATEPRGNQDFGWGPIFIPDGYTKTWGEMNVEEQNPTAVRRIALEKLNQYLNNNPFS